MYPARLKTRNQKLEKVNMTIKFHLAIVPPKTTSQTKRLVMLRGRGPRFFAKPEHEKAEADLMALCAPHAPPTPLQGPVSLSVAFVFPWRKSESAKTRIAGSKWCDTRPDLDNMVKLLGDVLTRANFYADDGQVAVMSLQKQWGPHPGITVTLSSLSDSESAKTWEFT